MWRTTAHSTGEDIKVQAHCRSSDGACPDCGVLSSRVHSCYERTLRDLPAHGRRMLLRVRIRRFRCSEAACARMTFAEPLTDVVAGRFARRTARSDQLVHQIADRWHLMANASAAFLEAARRALKPLR